jgi:hypothetical protein
VPSAAPLSGGALRSAARRAAPARRRTVDGAALLDGVDDGGELVVHQHDVRRLARHVWGGEGGRGGGGWGWGCDQCRAHALKHARSCLSRAGRGGNEVHQQVGPRNLAARRAPEPPLPMATPIWARFSAGASFTPSPVTATTCGARVFGGRAGEWSASEALSQCVVADALFRQSPGAQQASTQPGAVQGAPRPPRRGAAAAPRSAASAAGWCAQTRSRAVGVRVFGEGEQAGEGGKTSSWPWSDVEAGHACWLKRCGPHPPPLPASCPPPTLQRISSHCSSVLISLLGWAGGSRERPCVPPAHPICHQLLGARCALRSAACVPPNPPRRAHRTCAPVTTAAPTRSSDSGTDPIGTPASAATSRCVWRVTMPTFLGAGVG